MFKKPAILTAIMPLLMFLAAGPAQAGKHDPIYVPEAIQLPGGKSSDDVKKAIKKVLSDRKWEVRDIAPGQILGMYNKSSKRSSYTAIVDIRYDARTVRIQYKDSENLNYNPQDNTIHGTYNKWVRNMEKYIRSELGAN